LKEFSILKEYFYIHRWRLVLGLVCLFLVDGCQIWIPWLIKEAIDILTSGAADQDQIIRIGVMILILALGIGTLRFVWRYCIIGISRKIEEAIRNRFYRHLQTLSNTYYDHTTVGDLMAHATNDLEAVRMMCGMAVIASADAGLLMVASLIMMFSIHFTLTLYVLIPLPILTYTVLKLGPKLHKRFRSVQEGFSKLTQKAQETFSGIRVVKSFVQESAEYENFNRLNRDYIDRNLKLVRIWGILHPVIWTISGCCSVIILLIGGRRVIEGSMSIGDFVAFNSYLGILIWPMIAVGWVVNLYQRGRASLERLCSVLSLEPGIASPPDGIRQTVHGAIHFRDLTFSYNGDDPILVDLNLSIEPGEWIAIMGPTGSAKTTLVQLIARLYEPPSDTVFIDGIDVKSWDLGSLRSQIGFVPQQNFLFSETIANNICFEESLTDTEIEELSNTAQIHKDVDLFPEKYETLVGEKGISLSGGQKQRIAIARAMATHAPVLVLDDAFSAVDSETEKAILQELKRRAGSKTVLLVSHRISTARCADKIVFLEDGKIIEEGTHIELLKLRGRYFEIFEHQRLLDEIDDGDTHNPHNSTYDEKDEKK